MNSLCGGGGVQSKFSEMSPTNAAWSHVILTSPISNGFV